MTIGTFSPHMESHIEGFSVIGELKWRAWDGIVADLWDVACTEGARGRYMAPYPRLFMPLSIDGNGTFKLSGKRADHDFRAPVGQSLSYIPANYPTRSRATGITRIRHMDLHLSEAAIQRRFGKALSRDRLETPRLVLDDPRISVLANMIAETLETEAADHRIYLEGLGNALLALLFDVKQEPRRRRPALSRTQLSQAVEYIHANCCDPLRLSELAELVGLSETYFSHAFKAAAGVAPHRYVMQARVRQAQKLLCESEASAGSVAAQCGFADQAHFNRVFRSIVGTSPAAWKREQQT